jgi:hypothetical protein
MHRNENLAVTLAWLEVMLSANTDCGKMPYGKLN